MRVRPLVSSVCPVLADGRVDRGGAGLRPLPVAEGAGQRQRLVLCGHCSTGFQSIYGSPAEREDAARMAEFRVVSFVI